MNTTAIQLTSQSVASQPLGTSKDYHDYVLPLYAVSMKDVALVGGKNASLGEMIQSLAPLGIRIPEGFAVTTNAWLAFLEANNLLPQIQGELAALDRNMFANLHEVGSRIRAHILLGDIPHEVASAIVKAYKSLSAPGKETISVAIRSSATAEDLPGASFAGQLESYLNVRGEDNLLEAIRKCFASLFTDRAIKYREDKGFDHVKALVSVGIQRMVRSDLGSSGVAFTIEPDSGFANALLVTGSWGLGENVVQGTVEPDEFLLFKPALRNGKRAVISRTLGAKQKMMVYGEATADHPEMRTWNTDTSSKLREQYVLTDLQLEELGDWLLAIEEHFEEPMDVEWALDGVTNELWIVQARPETVRSREKHLTVSEYELTEEGILLSRGMGLGHKIVTGRARILRSPREEELLHEGEVLITDVTSPDWDPILKRAAAIVTNKGGRTSHAAIVARELGTPAIVGAGNATTAITDGEMITVVCDAGGHGSIYRGELRFVRHERKLDTVSMPQTKPMFILADPDRAFQLSFYPNAGVGLLRIEFIITDRVRIHPMALVNFNDLKDATAKTQIEQLTKGYTDKKQFFVDKLAEGVATIAAAFYPKDVIVRMSDFKTNEYANLIGGIEFEPKEENPMLGFRGASRYYNPRYQAGFELECQAMRLVGDEMGFDNVKLMVPFCRTVEEGKKVVRIMEEQGLRQGENGLEIYVMAEIPSNIIQAREFAQVFDGFSIGSNDLTQLTLGIDRDSSLLRTIFDESNEAVKRMIASVILTAREMHRKIGLCGQAPSDNAEFADFLVQQQIDSISFNPDALLQGIENIHRAEAKYQTHFDLTSQEALMLHRDHSIHDFDNEE